MEFLILFPFVVAMLYTAAVYGITFFAKYQMQDAVDRAVATGLYVDRSDYQAGEELADAVSGHAQAALDRLTASLPAWPGEREGSCVVEPPEEGSVTVVRCSLLYGEFQQNPIVPAMSFGMLGTFPPLPDELKAEARVAF